MERNNVYCNQCKKTIGSDKLAWFSDAGKDLDFCSENCYFEWTDENKNQNEIIRQSRKEYNSRKFLNDWTIPEHQKIKNQKWWLSFTGWTFFIWTILFYSAFITISFSSSDISSVMPAWSESFKNDPVQFAGRTLFLIHAIPLLLSFFGFLKTTYIYEKNNNKSAKLLFSQNSLSLVDKLMKCFGVIGYLLIGISVAGVFLSLTSNQISVMLSISGIVLEKMNEHFKDYFLQYLIKDRQQNKKKKLIQEFIQEIPNAPNDLKDKFLGRIGAIGEKNPLFTGVPNHWELWDEKEMKNFLRDLQVRWDDEDVKETVSSLLDETGSYQKEKSISLQKKITDYYQKVEKEIKNQGTSDNTSDKEKNNFQNQSYHTIDLDNHFEEKDAELIAQQEIPPK